VGGVVREHGTRAKYVVDGCRCDECREASRVYGQEWRNDIKPRLVSGDPAREHVKELMAAGMGYKRIAELAGVSASAVSSLLWGKPGRPPTPRIKPSTAEAVLSVTANLDSLADGTRVPAGPTHAAIAKLTAAGVPRARIAERLGIGTLQVRPQQTYVTARIARTVAEMAAELDAGTLVTHRDSRHGTTVIAPEATPSRQRTFAEAAEIDRFLNEMADVFLDKHQPWRAQAACRGEERPVWLWFSARGDKPTQDKARRICEACPVRQECLEYAVSRGERVGMWGGKSANTYRLAQYRASKGFTRQCPVCLEDFDPGMKQKLCSDECRRESRRRTLHNSYLRAAS
jgi:DNA-binding CsgD family transcriptional regulator